MKKTAGMFVAVVVAALIFRALTYNPILILERTIEPYDSVSTVAYSPDGKTLACGLGYDMPVVELRNVETGRIQKTLRGHAQSVHCIAYHPGGEVIASASRDKSVKLWHVETGDTIATLLGHTDEVYAVAFSKDGKTLASGSWDKSIRLWDFETRTLKHVLTWDPATGSNPSKFPDHANAVDCVTFSPDGKTLATGGFDRTIRLWDVASAENTSTLRGHSGGVHCVAFSPDGKLLASGSEREIKLWEMPAGVEIGTLDRHHDFVSSVVFSPNSEWLASSSWDRTIKVWNVRSRKEVDSARACRKYVYDVTFSKDGKQLASSGINEISLWDVSELYAAEKGN